MKLYIDAKGGMAGDMFSAALISAGADKNKMFESMQVAAEKLGTADVSSCETSDGATQLTIDLCSNKAHIQGTQALSILQEMFELLDIKQKYKTFGFDILDVLLKAEQEAHSKNSFLTDHIHKQNHTHTHEHTHDHTHNHEHTHDYGHETTHLHEAQDIIIDILGAVIGMQELDIETQAFLSTPVSVGGGYIEFSHGKLSVPAPATEIILNKYNIEYKKGPIETELCTPTGAAILAALKVSSKKTDEKTINTGISRGTKILDISPLKLMIC